MRSFRVVVGGALACVESYTSRRALGGASPALRRAPRRFHAGGALQSWLSDAECAEVLDFWFEDAQTRERWFASTRAFDEKVEARWGAALRAEREALDVAAMRSESILAHVVLWDQLARHAVRVGDASHSDAVAPARFADRAVSAARELVARDDAWPATYKSFALMPLRHTFDAGVLNLEVLPTMRKWRAAGGNADDAKVWQRFEAATLRALCRVTTQTLDPVAVPDAPQAADGGEVDWLGDFSDVLEPPLPSLSAALAARAPHASFDDGGNRRHVSSLETYKCVKRFLLDDAVSEAPDEEPDVGDGEEAPKPAARAVPRTVVVSVSGGVDSMLLLWVVARLAASEAVFAGMRVHAVHINYGNRGVSEREADFVQKWCGWLGVPLWRRDVTELAKASTASRADYEDVTRDVRFDVYKRALGEDVSAAALSEQAAFSAPPPASSRRAPAGRSAGLVLLGHNRQDASENLFTNINRGQHYENLRGMAPLSVERGVTVARPMLGIDKKTIYADAAKLHVPHTRDSTDPLCERGMLRDKWLPAVNAQQPLLIPGLERLADHVTFMHKAWERELSGYFARSVTVERTDDAISAAIRGVRGPS